MNCKYTFLLPAFKSKYFEEALRSIASQTFQDFVCIVSDDCSLDGIKEIFDGVVGTDFRFSFRRNDKNLGKDNLVAHWNLLVDLCKTDYFIMASDDDVYGPDYLKEIDSLVQIYPTVDMFRARMQSIDEFGNVLRQDPQVQEYLDQLNFLSLYYSEYILSCEACFCYRTEIAKKIGKYKEFPLAWFSDDAQHIQLSKNGCAVTSTIQFSYRFSNCSISSTWENPETAKKKLVSTISFYDWFIKYYPSVDNLSNENLKNRIYSLIQARIIDHINRRSISCNWKGFIWLMLQLDGRLGISRVNLLSKWLQPKIDRIRKRIFL